MTIEMIEVEEFNQGTQIKVIGVGGGGGNAVAHMMERDMDLTDALSYAGQPQVAASVGATERKERWRCTDPPA